VERLAQHALRGAVWEKALAYGRQAGNKAQTRSAYREAVVCYEQALAALEHVPDSRVASEQAIDLRLGLPSALKALREAPERMLEHLRRAETLAETLGDQRRLGQIDAVMSLNFWVAGDMDRAIATNQRALAVATTLGHVGLQAQTHLSLGRVYYDTGDYARAVESLERNVAMLQGALLYEHFGSNNIVAAASRAWLSLLPCRTRCVHGGARHGRRRAPDRGDWQ
jgi:tetratricopeptide (TPR) repeat protein